MAGSPGSGEYTLGKELEVRLYDAKVGVLKGNAGNGLVFQYDATYATSPDAVPLGSRSRLNEEPWPANLTRRWFEDLLPEGTRRHQLARQLGIIHVDTWSLLEAAGDECAGAVRIVAPDYQGSARLFRLDQDTLTYLLRPATEPIDEEHRAARLSLAGAQNKTVLFRHNDSEPWQLPAYGHPSSHILKPEHPDFPALVQNEHWCMEVARRAGIHTARTSIERIGDLDVLVIERYDRTRDTSGKITRVHQEDLAQALGSHTKYQDEGFPNTYHLAGVRGVDTGSLFDRLILNWLLGNCDAHAKNYSILEPGTPRARLAPVYDLVSTEAYELSQVMGTSIGNARTLNAVTANAIEHMGRNLGVSDPIEQAAGIAQRVHEAIEECRTEGTNPGPVPTNRILERIAKTRGWRQAGQQTGAIPEAEAIFGPPADPNSPATLAAAKASKPPKQQASGRQRQSKTPGRD